jgi:hypothetical protein
MNIRVVVSYFCLLACAVSTFALAPSSTRAQTPQAATQPMFEGDRTCGDNPTDCPFPSTVALHRYLHIVLHDVPGDVNWGVWVGLTCASATAEAYGAMPVRPSGFVEAVVDLQAGHVPSWQGRPLCFLFRGGFGRASTYYATYFDDTQVPDAESVLPNYEQLGGRPDLADLDVTYIHRDPAYAYDGSPNMPRVGQNVTYTAHVLNQGGRPITAFRYRWLRDGKVVQVGQYPKSLPAFSDAPISLTVPWTVADHRLTVRVETPDTELSPTNNGLSIDTNAISLGFWVERSAYSYFRDYQLRFCAIQGCAGSDSFEDWLQRQVTAWNALFHRAIYPGLATNGILTRVRVDKIMVVQDEALPLHGGIASDAPDRLDHSVDLEWGLPSKNLTTAYGLNSPGPFRIDWALLHELGHARSLADLYRFDFPVDSPSQIDVRAANGQPAYNPLDPFGVGNPIRGFSGSDGGTLVYQNVERDLMSCVCSAFYSSYSALVLNRLGNRRAVCGNFNAPCNIGDWYRDIPPKNVVRVRGASGRKLAGPVTLRLFFDSGVGYGTHRFIEADSAVLAGKDAEFALPSDPFRSGGSSDRAGHNLLLVEVTAPGIDRFCFQEPTDLNMAYWTGYVDASHPAVFTLRLDRIWQNACRLTRPPALVNEPFSTSVAKSSTLLSSTRRSAHAVYRLATARLYDASGVPMHRRYVVMRDELGRIVGQGTTAQDGTFSARVSSSVRSIAVDDVTDNHLILEAGSATPPQTVVQPR